MEKIEKSINSKCTCKWCNKLLVVKIEKKPEPDKLKEFKIKKDSAFMIGDSKSDYLASKRAGIRFEFKKKCPLDKQVKSIVKEF